MIAVDRSYFRPVSVSTSVIVGNSDETIFVETVGGRPLRFDGTVCNINEMIKEIAFCDLLPVETRGWLLDHVITIHQQLVIRETEKRDWVGLWMFVLSSIGLVAFIVLAWAFFKFGS